MSCAAADRRVAELEQQVASLEKATNDDTQSEDRRGLLMKAERAETRAQKMEQQVRVACVKLCDLLSKLADHTIAPRLSTAVGQRKEVCTGNIRS